MNKMKKLLTILAVVGLILVGSSPAGAGELWGTGSPDWGSGANGPSPVIFKFDTSTGSISMTFRFENSNWMWISGLADSGKYLYASHNTYNTDPETYLDTHDFKIAKINRYTGEFISETSIAGFLGQMLSQVNALDFHDGRLYGVENATSESTIRGYAIEILLDPNGNVFGATLGAYIGPYPDAGLDFHDGLWYATSWGHTPTPKKQGSIVYTSPNIMSTPFTQVGTGDSAVQGIGMIDGWEFDEDGNLFAVSWYDPSDWVATEVYSINMSTRQATFLYDLSPQLPPSIISLDGLSEVRDGPVTTNVVAAPNPVMVSGSVTLTANVDDTTTGGSKIKSAEYSLDGGTNWLPMVAKDGAFDGVSEDVTGTVTAPAIAGVYNLCVRGTDYANTGLEECTMLVVYDPAGGFVTGGGWIWSPAGAYIKDLNLEGKANFGFVSKYQKGATVPTGQTEFQFKVADLNFKSTSYQWLVVAGARAQYKGSGTINGSGEYGFMLTAIDGQISSGGGVDKFRVKIWETATDTIVYDNKFGSSDAGSDATVLGGGSIVIHK